MTLIPISANYGILKANDNHDALGRFAPSPGSKRRTQGFDWDHGQRPGLFGLPDIAVTSFRGDEFGADRKAIRVGAMAHLNEIRRGDTPLVNRDTGWTLAVGNKDWEKIAKNTRQSTESLQAIAGLSSLVERAVLAESHLDVEHQNTDVQGVHRLYAPVGIGGKLYRVKLTVRDYNGADSGAKTNLHALQAIEIESAPLGTFWISQGANPSQTSQPTTERTLSVLALLQGSKREDGTPWDSGEQPLTKAVLMIWLGARP